MKRRFMEGANTSAVGFQQCAGGNDIALALTQIAETSN